MKKIALLLSLLLSTAAFSAELVSHTGKVLKISGHSNSYTTYGVEEKGILFLFLEGLPNACVDGMQRIAITHDHPLYSTLLSVALIAKSTGEPMTIVYLDECNVRANAWDFGSFTY